MPTKVAALHDSHSHTASRDPLAHVRQVIASNDREGALAVLLALITRGRSTALELPEFVAAALIATARAARDEPDRLALQTFRQAQVAVDEILALVREAPLATDDLDRIRAAVDERQQRDRTAREGDVDKLLGAARDTTSAAFDGVQGRTLAIRLGQGWLEARYVRDRDTGHTYGPYLYQRWREAGRKRARYLGKVAQ
jgi:hypothetical protein